MMNVWQALGFIGLGMMVANCYNWYAWRKFYEGRKCGHERERGRKS